MTAGFLDRLSDSYHSARRLFGHKASRILGSVGGKFRILCLPGYTLPPDAVKDGLGGGVVVVLGGRGWAGASGGGQLMGPLSSGQLRPKASSGQCARLGY